MRPVVPLRAWLAAERRAARWWAGVQWATEPGTAMGLAVQALPPGAAGFLARIEERLRSPDPGPTAARRIELALLRGPCFRPPDPHGWRPLDRSRTRTRRTTGPGLEADRVAAASRAALRRFGPVHLTLADTHDSPDRGTPGHRTG